MSSAPALETGTAVGHTTHNHPLKAVPAEETDTALSMDQNQTQKAATAAGTHNECLRQHGLTGAQEGPCAAAAAGGQATPAAAPEAAEVAEAAPSVAAPAASLPPAEAAAAAAMEAAAPADPSQVDAGSPAPVAAAVTADADAGGDAAAGDAAVSAGGGAPEVAAAGNAVAPAAGEAPAAAAGGAAAAAASYGAAAACLQDPACQPGTPEFEAAKAGNEELLQLYNTLERQIHAKKAFKPDMQACSQLKLRRDLQGRFRAGVYGHIPGVAVGAQFLGRGQLAVLGLHSQMMKGIDCKNDYPRGEAVAICMAGGYKDDDDTGATITYTGAGGQKGKRQVKDQSYEYADNAALVRNYESSTPVRVFRGQKAKNKGEFYPIYAYEGLYTITGHRMEPSADGPLVIRFTLQGVPGHYVVSNKVEYKSLHRSQAFTRIQLTGEGGRRPAKRRKKTKGQPKWSFVVPRPDQIASRIRERQEAGSHGRLVSADLSEGAEPVPIPVWNDVDDDDTFHVCGGLAAATQQQAAEHDTHSRSSDQSSGSGGQSSGSGGQSSGSGGQSSGSGGQSSGGQSSGSGGQGFRYVTDYSFAGKAMEELVALAGQRFAEACTTTCGIDYHGGECPYNVEDCLMATNPYGVMECGPNCKAGKGGSKLRRHLCKRNRVVSEGIKCPLEIFKVPGKGWGVRCSVDVPAGAVLCSYIGKLTTDEAAEQLRGADMYLYDLSHFTTLEEENARQPDPDANPLLPPVPAELPQHLVVDAGQEGNVARFINHACAPNCVVQPVLTKNARSHLLYYNAIVAQEDIPAFSELTYNYYYQHHNQQPAAADEAAAAAAAGGGGADGTSSSHAAQDGARRVPCVCGAANCCKWLLIS